VITTGIVAFLVASCCGTAMAVAEDAPYAEYRFVRELGQIQIVTGFMDRSPDLPSRRETLERQGIVVLETDTLRTFTRTERVRAHRVVTTISVMPPVGHGEGGASSNVDVKIVVDGTTRVECPLWSAALGLDRIVVEPERSYIMVHGHEGVVRFDGFEPRGRIDAEWLTRRAKFVEQLLGGPRERRPQP
jgi:hypothetical protein